MGRSKKQQSYRLGILSEYLTMVLLTLKGYKVLAHRFKTKAGEIDLVAKQGNTLVFVEVKARKGHEDYEVLLKQQQQRIANAARLYMGKNQQFSGLNARFDLVVWRAPCWLKHYKHIWIE